MSDSPFRLDGRTALVTGASGGLGQRFARVPHGAGARLVLIGRDPEHPRRRVDVRAHRRRVPQRRIGEPSDLDGALLPLASDASRYTAGSDVVVDGDHLCSTL